MGVADRDYKNHIYENFARIGKAISSPKRLELLDLLLQAEQTVEVLATKANTSVANASKHLKVLHAARLVDARKEGLYVHYRIPNEYIRDFLMNLRTLGEEQIAEINQITKAFFEGYPGLDAISADTLIDKIREGTVLVLDVRPKDEYQSGHIPRNETGGASEGETRHNNFSDRSRNSVERLARW